MTPTKEVIALRGKKLTQPMCHLQKLKKIFSGVKDLSEGDEAHQLHSKGVLDWGIGTSTLMGLGVEYYPHNI